MSSAISPGGRSRVDHNDAGHAPHPLALIRGVSPRARDERGTSPRRAEASRSRRSPSSSAPCVEIGPASARRTSSWTPAANIARVRSAIRCVEHVLRHVEADDDGRMPRLPGPQPVPRRRERRAASASSSARTTRRRSFAMHGGRGGGIDLSEPRMGGLRPALVVERRPPLPGARRRRRRQVELGERRPEIETRATNDHRRPAGRRISSIAAWASGRVLPDRGLLLERPDPHQPGRVGRLVREDRQVSIDLHRVRRDELGRDPRGHLLRPPRTCHSRSGRRCR